MITTPPLTQVSQRPLRAGRWLLLALLLASLAPGHAYAEAVGAYPDKVTKFTVYGKAVQMGASLVTNFTDYRYNDALKAQSSDKIVGVIPKDAVIKGAWLFWGGSAPKSGGGGWSIDNTVSLTTPDGAKTSVIADGACLTHQTKDNQGTVQVNHFYCRKDVTSLVSSHPGLDTWNGVYSVGDLQARVANIQNQGCGSKLNTKHYPNIPETTCCVYQPGNPKHDPHCQAHHASWSMVVIYDTKFSDTTERDIHLYDGFLLLDETKLSAGQKTFQLDGFLVGDPPQARIAYYAMEGDKHLGNPYQWGAGGKGGPDSYPCQSCPDYIAFNGSKLSGGAGNGEVDNIFNSTPETSIDLDSFDVSKLVKPQDVSASVLVSSGDGIVAGPGPDPDGEKTGYGELLLYGYTLLEINRLAPNFKNAFTKFRVDGKQKTTAVAGQELSFTLDVFNVGDLDALSTVVKLDTWPPPGTEYVPGTTVVDGKTIADIGVQSALMTGLQLGTITGKFGGDQQRSISFKLKVKDPPGVASFKSNAVLTYQYKGSSKTFDGKIETEQVEVDIVQPTFGLPVLIASPDKVKPGGNVEYSLSITNTSNQPAVIDSLRLDMPSEVLFASATGPGANASAKTGGAKGTGFALFTKATVAPGQTAIWKINGTLKSAAQLKALGVSQLHGHVVTVQGLVKSGSLDVKTDSPQGPGKADPTTFTVDAPASLAKSSKEGLDLTPATPLQAGDDMQFTITVVNDGQGDAVVDISDVLAGPLDYVSSPDPQVKFNNGAVTISALTVKAGITETFTFKVKIKANTPPNTKFKNSATIFPKDGSPPVVIQTGEFTVMGGTDLTQSLKTFDDLNGGDIEPGDILRYTIVLINNGKQPSGTLQVSDPVDGDLDQITKVSGGSNGSYDAGTHTVLWSVPSLPGGGGKAVLSFDARVKPGLPNGTALDNTASVTGQELPEPLQLTANTKVKANPVISLFTNVVTSSGGADFEPGDTVTYTITVHNTGNGAVENAQLITTYDPVLEIKDVAGGKVNGQQVTWDLADFAPGPAKKIVVTATLKASIKQGTQVSNQVELTGGGLSAKTLSDDPGKPGQNDATIFDVKSAPDLTASAKAFTDVDGGSVQGGDAITFTITVTNTGNAPASNVVVTDVLHKALTNVQVTGGSFDAGTSTASWPAVTVNPGDPPLLLKLSAVVDKTTASGTTVTNTAKVAFTETPGQHTTNTISFKVENLPDFGTSTKAVSAAAIAAGDKVTYTITVTNTGNLSGSAIVVTDAVPPQLTGVVATDGSFANGTATWTVGTLAAGQSKVLSLEGTLAKPLADGLEICNSAAIKAAENPAAVVTVPPGADPKPGGEPTCFKVQSAAKATASKDVFDAATGAKINGGQVKPKQVVRYQVTVVNGGNDVAKQVVISDPVDANLDDIKPLDSGSYDAGTGVITWPTVASLGLGAGDQVVVRFEATVKAGLDNGTKIDNQASVTWEGAAAPSTSDDPATPAANDATSLSVISNIDFSKATKTVVDSDGGDPKPGDELQYTITVPNQGDAIGKDVVITDPLPPQLESVVPADGGILKNGVITWQGGNIAPGETVTVHFTAKLKKPLPAGVAVSNQAQVTAKGFAAPVLTDANLATPVREPTVIKVVAKVDLGTSAWSTTDVNGGTVEPGDEIIFRLVLRNTGDALAVGTQVKALFSKTTLSDIQTFDDGVLAGEEVLWGVPLIGLTPAGDVELRFKAKVKEGLANGTKITVVADIPSVLPPPQVTLQVDAKPKLETSTLAVDDESGWLLKINQVGPGHKLRFEVTVRNTGKVAATDVVVNLPLPAAFEDLVAITPGSISGNSITWTLPKVAGGGTALVVATAKVKASAVDGSKLTPSATLKPSELSTVTTVVGPTITVLKRPLLKVTKGVDDLTGNHLFPGDSLRFHITVANVGNAAAQSLVIEDEVGNIALDEIQVESGGTLAGTTATWKIPTLEVGQSVTVAFRAKVGKGVSNGATLVNQATAKPANGDLAASNQAAALVDYPTLAVLAVWAPQPPATVPATPGDLVELQVTVGANAKEPATAVRVRVPIDPALFEMVDSGGGAWDSKAQTLIWEPGNTPALATIDAGSQLTLKATLKVRSTAPHGAVAKAIATAREGETQIAWTSPPANLPIASAPKLVLSKTVLDLNGGKVAPLDVLRYRIEVQVQGAAAAQQVQVVDTLDANLEVVAVGAKGVANGQEITWAPPATAELALIEPGDVVVLEVDIRVLAEVANGTKIANQAFGNAVGLDAPVGSDDPATDTVGDPTVSTVRVVSALEASTKTGTDDNGAPLLAGDTVTWRITVIATAGQPVNNVRLIDPIPAGMDYILGSTRLNGSPAADVDGTSPLVQGLAVASPGASAGTVQPGVAGAAIVEFRTRVRSDVVDGAVVSNLATAVADQVPPTPIGPAVMVVGKGASLRRTDKVVTLIDTDGNGKADPGDALRYAITVHNDGAAPADETVLEDPIPEGVQYIGGTLRLDDAPLSDAADGDAGHVDAAAGKVVVQLGSIATGAARTVVFQVRIGKTKLVSNQAVVQAKGLAPEPSDSDGDDSNGNQPTVITVSGGAAMTVTKVVQDENGGQVIAGDWLRYTIAMRNHSDAPFNNVELIDLLPAGLSGAPQDVLVPPGAQLDLQPAADKGAGTLRVTGITVLDGDQAVVSLRVKVADTAPSGQAICNTARARFSIPGPDAPIPIVDTTSKPACVTIGATAGVGVVRGVVFEDVGAEDGAFAEGDLFFTGYQVLIQPPAGQTGPTLSAITDSQGRYLIEQVPAGERRVRVLSAAGTLFLETTFDQGAGDSRQLDLALAPTGRVYDAKAGTGVAGIKVFLYYDAADPIAPGQLVPESDLGIGQQGQTTGRDGAYVFAPPAGRAYRIDAAGAGGTWAFPSSQRAPEPGLALLDKLGMVVADALPKLTAGLPRYFTRFTRQGASGDQAPPSPRHNHLPVDAMADAIKLSVHLSKAQARIGEVVHVTVTAENGSTHSFAADLLTAKGGVVIRHLLPEGLGRVAGAARLQLFEKGLTKPTNIALAPMTGPLLEAWRATPIAGHRMGLDLPAGAKLVLHMQTVVLPSAQLGAWLMHRSQLVDPAGVELSKAAMGRMQVRADPLFDRGIVMGKVFCDADGDGDQDPGEPGLPGARVYADNGHYADSDRHGRFHLVDIHPGNHLFKLDLETTPPGSTMTTDVKRVLYVTRGIALGLRFGVSCELDTVRPQTVQPAPRKRAQEIDENGAGVVSLRGATESLEVIIDERTLPPQWLRAALVHGAAKPPTPLPTQVTPVVVLAHAALTIRVQSEGAFTRHALEVREVDARGGIGAYVFERSWRGKPPALLVVQPPADAFKADRRYVAVLRAETRYRAGAWSAPMPMQIAGQLKAGANAPWRLKPRPRLALANGQRMDVQADGRFAELIARPADGRLIVGLRAADGRRRDAYVSLAPAISPDRVKLPPAGGLLQSVVRPEVPAEVVPPPETPKPAPKPAEATPKPAPKPPPKPAPKPVGKPAPKPVAKPTPKPAPKPVVVAPKPAPKPVVVPPKPAPKPVVVAPKPAPKPVVAAPKPAPKPVVKPAPKPVPKPKPAVVVPKPAPKPAPKPVVVVPKPTPKPKPAVVVPKPAPKPKPKPAPARPGRTLVPVPGKASGAAWVDVPIAFEMPMGVRIAGVRLDPVSQPLKLRVPNMPLPMAEGRILGRVVLSTEGMPEEAKEAAVVVMDREGHIVQRTRLPVPLPSTFFWDPSSAIQGKALKAGRYGLAMEVLIPAPGGAGSGLVGWRTAPATLRLLAGGVGLVPSTPPDKVVRADLFRSNGELTPSLGEWLERSADTLRQRTRHIAVVSVHSITKDSARRTTLAAKNVRAALLDAGVRRDRLVVFGVGAALPDADPDGSKLGVDRIEIRFRHQVTGSSGSTKPKPFTVTAGLWVAGKPVIGDGNRPPRTVRVRVGKPTLIELQQDDGQGRLWKRVLAVNPGAEATSKAPQVDDKGGLMHFGAGVIDQMRRELDKADQERAAARAEAAARKKAGKKAAKKGEAVDKAVDKPGGKAADKASAKSTDKAVTGAMFTPPPQPAASSELPAARLAVVLPKEGAKLRSERLAISGRTAPGNAIKINGREVLLDGDGSFYTVVKLKPGRSKLIISATDKAGNVAKIERTVELSERAFFLLAIADTALAQTTANIQGLSDQTTIKVGDKLKLHGRAALYLKGRIKGDWAGFKSIRYTAHVDTAKDPDIEDFKTNLLDPERFYPVYGDASEDVQDARARGKVYVLVEADRSTAMLGNFRSAIGGFELVRYDRAMYGAMVHLNKVLGGDFDTQAKAFVATEDRQLSRRTDLMRGTGGSLFYLSGRDVLAGSEKVWVVIRDRDSNMELGRVPQARNNDYTIDYREGRLLFKSPVSSAVDSFFTVGSAGQPGQYLHWNGHAVFVHVTYEARNLDDGVAGTNFGGQLQEKLAGGKVTLGGTYVQEQRDGSEVAYQLAGAHAELKIGKHSRLRAEYGWSRSRDSLVSVSDDGGLTFGTGDAQTGGHLDSRVSGHALGLRLDSDMRDLGGLFGVQPLRLSAAKAGEKDKAPKRWGHVKAWYKWVQQGFHTGGVLTEQGQQKAGAETIFAIAPGNNLALRYDAIFTDSRRDPFQGVDMGPLWGAGALATSGSFTPLQRQMATIQDSHRMGRWTLLGSLGWMHADDAVGTGRHSGTVTGGAAYRVTPRLTLRGEQQFIGGGDPNQYRPEHRYTDHFATVAGGEYKLGKDLSIVLNERIGWGGQNATMAGIRTRLDERSSLYLQQRLEDSYDTGRPVSATVLGAESRYGNDKTSRAWGEYQVDALNAGRMNRAIMGVGKRFQIAPGLNLDASYERSQTFSGPVGETARDALSVGGEWLRHRLWKLTSRQEVRVDRGDENYGGQRRLQIVSLNAITARATRSLTFFGRANYLRTDNQTLDRLEAETLQGTIGTAWRPAGAGRLNVISKYTHLIEKRPVAADLGVGEHSIKHIFSVEPIVELPANLQWSHKLALRRAKERFGEVPEATVDTWLFISRMGYHLSSMVDAAAEYRFLKVGIGGDNGKNLEHGALVEAAWLVGKALRVGAGYNFSRFAETAAGDIERNEGGFFLRMIGMY